MSFEEQYPMESWDLYETEKERQRLQAENELLRSVLTESHKLLQHYSVLLNQYDGGLRHIPVSVEEWINRVEASR